MTTWPRSRLRQEWRPLTIWRHCGHNCSPVRTVPAGRDCARLPDRLQYRCRHQRGRGGVAPWWRGLGNRPARRRVRTVLATAFIAGCLAASGVTGLLPLVAPAVLPLLFDVRQVRLRPSQEMVFAELRLSPEARSGGLTADELYARLSAQTQPRCPGLTSRTSLTRYAGRVSPTRPPTAAWSCARQTTPG
jgi:hypothetical protein